MILQLEKENELEFLKHQALLFSHSLRVGYHGKNNQFKSFINNIEKMGNEPEPVSHEKDQDIFKHLEDQF